MFRRRAFLAVAAAALAVAVCPGQQPAAPALQGQGTPAAQAPPSTFRAMTYNIHHGEGVDGRLDIERIAALIRDERADLVALQEVDRGVERTKRRDLPSLPPSPA